MQLSECQFIQNVQENISWIYSQYVEALFAFSFEYQSAKA